MTLVCFCSHHLVCRGGQIIWQPGGEKGTAVIPIEKSFDQHIRAVWYAKCAKGPDPCRASICVCPVDCPVPVRGTYSWREMPYGMNCGVECAVCSVRERVCARARICAAQ